MQHMIGRRCLAGLLCLALTLALSACAQRVMPPAADPSAGGAAQAGGDGTSLSGSKGEADPAPEAAVPSRGERPHTPDAPADGEAAQPELEPEQAAFSQAAADSLALVYETMSYNDAYLAAAAYLGRRESDDATPLPQWIAQNCPKLTEEMPFLLEIPEDRIIGGSHGDLYCFVPRDPAQKLKVEHVTWVKQQFDVSDEHDAVLYETTDAEPFLVYVGFEYAGLDHMPNIYISTERANGVPTGWFPMVDAFGSLDLPEEWWLFDFGVWGYGWDEYEGEGSEDLPDDVWWLPPTAMGLADTNWSCDHWYMELHWGDGAQGYDGTVDLYYQGTEGQGYELAYIGEWRMEDDCLRLELFDGAMFCIDGSYPVRIDPSGEYLSIEADPETGVCPPFFPEGTSVMDLALVYG